MGVGVGVGDGMGSVVQLPPARKALTRRSQRGGQAAGHDAAVSRGSRCGPHAARFHPPFPSAQKTLHGGYTPGRGFTLPSRRRRRRDMAVTWRFHPPFPSAQKTCRRFSGPSNMSGWSYTARIPVPCSRSAQSLRYVGECSGTSSSTARRPPSCDHGGGGHARGGDTRGGRARRLDTAVTHATV